MAQQIQEKTIKVGVVGGGFGRTHLLAYHATPGVEVKAFCQRTKAKAEQIAREFGIPQVFTDYREMISHTDLDAVSLTTPTNVHLAMACEAFDAGVSVLCEKPLAMNKEEAAAMLKRAEEARLIHMTCFNFRYVPAFYRMKELMQEGYVGSHVLHVRRVGSVNDGLTPIYRLDGAIRKRQWVLAPWVTLEFTWLIWCAGLRVTSSGSAASKPFLLRRGPWQTVPRREQSPWRIAPFSLES